MVPRLNIKKSEARTRTIKELVVTCSLYRFSFPPRGAVDR
jgi:hypothetical protein